MRLYILGGGVLILLLLGALVFVWFFGSPDVENQNIDSPSVTDPFGSAGSVGNNGSTGGITGGSVQNGGLNPDENASGLNNASQQILSHASSTESAYSMFGGVFYVIGEHDHATSTVFNLLVAGNGGLYVQLEEAPIGKARRLAEEFVLGRFGLSKDELCTATHTVMAAPGIDEGYGDTNLGFSFCEGSVVLREI